jgi:hypothetical protein
VPKKLLFLDPTLFLLEFVPRPIPRNLSISFVSWVAAFAETLTMQTSTIVAISVGTIVTGFLGMLLSPEIEKG